jgi:hypothetical protein
MDEDASLEEFAAGTVANSGSTEESRNGEETGEPTESAETESSIAEQGADDTDSDESVSPTVSTYGYAPGKAACGACGTRVRRRWRDGDGPVCRDCKEW